MNIVVYYARCDAHPDMPPGINEDLWPTMIRRVHDLGYQLTLLTTPGSGADALPHDQLMEFAEDADGNQIDPSQCALAREQCWHRYLRDWLADGEQACMIEPDIYLHKKIKPLDGVDLLLLKRQGNPYLTCFRLCTNKAEPYYDRMRKIALATSDDRKRWYADIDAQEQILAHDPSSPEGVATQVTHWEHYVTRPMNSRTGYAWAFNGTAKRKMLELA